MPRKHPEEARVQFMPIRLNYLRNIKVLMQNPMLCIGLFFMKFVEYATSAVAIASTAL